MRSVFSWVVLLMIPSFLPNRFWSTVLVWSKIICPFFPWNVHDILVGYFRPLVVIGATMTGEI